MTSPERAVATDSPAAEGSGRGGAIDLHCHLIPGVDDGCQSVEESLDEVRQLIDAGFGGSVCTPHFWPEQYPHIVPEQIAKWTDQLRDAIRDAGLDYELWPGAEVRLTPTVVDHFESIGVPTLGASRAVLLDFWDHRWPGWVDEAFDWLVERGYRPVLAHPERLACVDELHARLPELRRRGVWLQGNCRPLVGGDGESARRWGRRFVEENAYDVMALDSHRPQHLADRLAGRQWLIERFGVDRVRAMLEEAPRRVLELTAAPARKSET